MEVRAVLRFLRASPRKVRLVADLIRGKRVGEALNILTFTEKRAARKLEKVLRSAVANASETKKVKEVDDLVISRVLVDPGPVWKRHMPRARGRATPIRKRTSHVTLILSGKEQGGK
ncbi:MAG: 50S ribosomal protein L22 [Candidatus Tectomicrobia bacterium]|uniref:Large ribosomal subunit protein uL22 n=1 Tax=Tectimicrobiota bacterium TaxID=2528274 RepID=A0A932GM79_UNCTE|nr:50S ribosomal protein L22 [Candidatus Tectomicrobia bacterium]